MKKNNDLGDYIFHKLQNINQEPNERIWDKIEINLEKKKKKRFYFYSIFYLFICLSIGYFLSQISLDSNKKTNKSVDQNSSKKENIGLIKNNSESEKTVTDSEEKALNSYEISVDSINSTEKITSQKSILSETEDYIIHKEVNIYKTLKHKKTVVTKNGVLISSNKIISSNNNASTFHNNKEALEIFSKTKSNSTFNSTKHSKNQDTKNTNFKNKIGEINETSLSKLDSIKLLTKKFGLYKSSKKHFKEANKETDSCLIPLIEQNIVELEKVDSDKVEEKIKEKSDTYISVYFGPTLYSSLTKGSSINSSLINTKKTISLNTSYGIYYRKMYGKVGFRIGISNTNLSYTTIIPNNDNQFLTDYYNIELNPNLTKEFINATFNGNSQIKLKQNLSYYELPLEVYKSLLRESKFGLDIFFGLTPQYLNKNNLKLESSNIKNFEIGKASNVRNVNLAFQIGLGINYKLSEKLQIDINPIFKYQTFPYEDYNNFIPIYIAIQSGLSYKF